jgi:hypothetical protein
MEVYRLPVQRIARHTQAILLPRCILAFIAEGDPEIKSNGERKTRGGFAALLPLCQWTDDLLR